MFSIFDSAAAWDFFFLFWYLAPLLKQQLLIPLWIIFKAKRITTLTDYHLYFMTLEG